MGWKTIGRKAIYVVLKPLINGLVKLGVTPNMVTTIGLLVNIAATIILIIGAELGDRNDFRYIGWAGATLLFGGLFDMIDGRLAREGKMVSDYGALYDSVLDRYSELFMFFGICYYLVSHNYFWSSIFAFIAMIGSVMVSYTRARAEGLGVIPSVGLMQRPERILIVAISAILCGLFSKVIGQDIKIEVDWFPVPLFETITIFTFPIFILAIWANLTALKRLVYSKQKLDIQK